MVDNTMVYIQYNHGDKKVIYTHHEPLTLLLEGIPEEVKNDEESKKAYLEERIAYYEQMGLFIPREKYELAPTDGFLYDQIFDEVSNSVSYVKRDVEMPAQVKIKSELEKAKDKILELQNEKVRLQETVNEQTNALVELTKELIDAKNENSGILKDVMLMVAEQNKAHVEEESKPVVEVVDKEAIGEMLPPVDIAPDSTTTTEEGKVEDEHNVPGKDDLLGGDGWLTPGDFPDGPTE